MMFQCMGEECVPRILDYIGEDYISVPYLYVNLRRYGVTNPCIKIWTDAENASIVGVYMLYYDTLHFYTRDERYSNSTFLNMMVKLDPKVMFIPSRIGDALKEKLSESCQLEKYYIVDLNVFRPLAPVDGVGTASRNDLESVADLMLTDPEYRTVYDSELLKSQLINRYDDRFSRYFIIRHGEKIIASYSTYGESDKLYILSGLVVHPDYRRRGLGNKIMRYAHRAVAMDGVNGVSCLRCGNTATLEIHKKMGSTVIASQYKVIRR